MGGVAGVCLQVSCFVSCSLTAALLAVCLPLGSGAVCNYLESCQLCRLQRPKVNIIGPITKLITFSVATVCGASLAGPSIHESMAPTVCLSTSAPLPATSPTWRPGSNISDMAPRPAISQHGAPASNKPHLTEKSTPVWLAIWRIWAGFVNSQHRNAAFATPNNICAHSSLLPHWAAAQT